MAGIFKEGIGTTSHMRIMVTVVIVTCLVIIGLSAYWTIFKDRSSDEVIIKTCERLVFGALLGKLGQKGWEAWRDKKANVTNVVNKS